MYRNDVFISGIPFMGPIAAARVGYIDGDYILNVTVTNQENQSTYRTLEIYVNNMIPTIIDVTITVNDLETDQALVGQTITFTANAFDPGVNDTLTYLWDFGINCGTPVCTAEGCITFAPKEAISNISS